MTEFNPERHQIETASALEVVSEAGAVDVYAAYVGWTCTKRRSRWPWRSRGEASRVSRRDRQQAQERWRSSWPSSARLGGGLLLFCYEAGPCGYVLYRQILACGHDCQVVAPSRIPKSAGGADQDRPTRCLEAGAAAAFGGSDGGVGAGSGAGARCAISAAPVTT